MSVFKQFNVVKKRSNSTNYFTNTGVLNWFQRWTRVNKKWFDQNYMHDFNRSSRSRSGLYPGTPLLSAKQFSSPDKISMYIGLGSFSVLLDPNDDWTIVFEVEAAAGTDGVQHDVMGSGNTNYWAIELQAGGEIAFDVSDGTNTYSFFTDGRAWSSGVKRHFQLIHKAEASYSGNNDTWYMDGTLQASSSSLTGVVNTATGGSDVMALLNSTRDGVTGLEGVLDEVAIIPHNGSATPDMLYEAGVTLDPRDLPWPAAQEYGQPYYVARADDETLTYGSAIGMYDGATADAGIALVSATIVNI